MNFSSEEKDGWTPKMMVGGPLDGQYLYSDEWPDEGKKLVMSCGGDYVVSEFACYWSLETT